MALTITGTPAQQAVQEHGQRVIQMTRAAMEAAIAVVVAMKVLVTAVVTVAGMGAVTAGDTAVLAVDMEVATVAKATDRVQARYREERRAYYARFPDFWATLPEDDQEYALLSRVNLSASRIASLHIASERLYKVLVKLAAKVQSLDSGTLHALGYPLPSIPYIHTLFPSNPTVTCGRFDFALTASGPKLLEFNAETPTFVKESFEINGQFCVDHDLKDPNEESLPILQEALRSAVEAGLTWVDWQPEDEPPLLVFAAYSDQIEDRETVAVYRNALKGVSVPFPLRLAITDLRSLRVHRDGLYTEDGQRISILYKLYPTEHLIHDEAPDGTPVGLKLLELVHARKLAILNPPAAFVLQNKATLALLWALHLTRDPLFTAEEHTWIGLYMLPTYLTEQLDNANAIFVDEPYVIKPVFGREGDSIIIRNADQFLEMSAQTYYKDQKVIYQSFVALPTSIMQTEGGREKLYLMHTCFVAAGKAAAIGVRGDTKRILNDTSYFIPLTLPWLKPRGFFLAGQPCGLKGVGFWLAPATCRLSERTTLARRNG